MLRNTDFRIALLLFLLTGAFYVFFKIDLCNPNTVSRLGLTLSLLEKGSLRIDQYEHLTIDKSFFEGHYYCDKAPGSSFLVLPVVAPVYYGLQASGVTDFVPYKGKEGSFRNFILLELTASLAVSGICALAVSCLYHWGRLLGASRTVSALTALLLGLGTPYWAWATVLFGHSLAAAFLIFACYLSTRQIQKTGPTTNRTATCWFAVGFLLAYAVWIEYTVAIPACLLGVFFVGEQFRKTRQIRSAVNIGLLLIVGGILPAIFFFSYNMICFDNPLTLGYNSLNEEFPEMQQGFYGIRTPSPVVLNKTLFSMRWGLFWYSPFLLFAPLLAVRNIVRNENRGLNILALVIPTYFCLLNASYAYWAATVIPCRHITACLPFFVIPFLSLDRIKPAFCRRFLTLLIYGSLLVRMASFFLPQAREFYLNNLPWIAEIRHPLRTTLLNLAIMADFPPITPNLTLLPMVILLCIFLWRELRAEPASKTSQN